MQLEFKNSKKYIFMTPHLRTFQNVVVELLGLLPGQIQMFSPFCRESVIFFKNEVANYKVKMFNFNSIQVEWYRKLR